MEYVGSSKATVEVSTENPSTDYQEIATNDLSSSSDTKIGNVMSSWRTSGCQICILAMLHENF